LYLYVTPITAAAISGAHETRMFAPSIAGPVTCVYHFALADALRFPFFANDLRTFSALPWFI